MPKSFAPPRRSCTLGFDFDFLGFSTASYRWGLEVNAFPARGTLTQLTTIDGLRNDRY
jgi:hypothetical protein